MKKILLYIGIAIVAIGCTKNNTPTNTAISFTAGVKTRLSPTDDCKWAVGDQIGIFTSLPEDNLLFRISDVATGAMTPDSSVPDIYPLSSDKQRTYCAYHPYLNTGDKPYFNLDYTEDQSKPLLWATTTSNNAAVTLQFKHIFPKIKFTLTAGGAEVSSLDGAKAWLTGAVAKGEFIIGSGEFTGSPIGDDVNLTLAFDTEKTSATAIAYLPPSKDVKLWITAQGKTYVKSFTNVEWTAGNSYVYDITVGQLDNN